MATPWRALAAARTLKAWRDTQLLAVAARLQAACEQWAFAWGVTLPPGFEPRATAATPNDAAGFAGAVFAEAPHGAAWVGLPADFEILLARALFDADPASTPVVQSVVAACRDDAVARIGDALNARPVGAGARAPATLPWSGDVTVHLPRDVKVLATSEAVEHLLRDKHEARRASPSPHLAPLSSVGEALARRRVPLQVALAGCAIDLGTLHTLQPGDVLPTAHALGAPAAVLDASGSVLFSARLVRSDGLRAVQFAPTASIEELAP